MSAHLVTMHQKKNGDTDFKIVVPEKSQQEKLDAVKKAFEERYGVNQTDRTAKQWRNLVETYGMETVCITEKMKEKEIKKRMKDK